MRALVQQKQRGGNSVIAGEAAAMRRTNFTKAGSEGTGLALLRGMPARFMLMRPGSYMASLTKSGCSGGRKLLCLQREGPHFGPCRG